ncbi:MAG: LysR family transcriptional regulator [Alphaproteobacteria bacterium]|nr:LysR family transcriptional regulator [Alphaproteobacteria bacterium]
MSAGIGVLHQLSAGHFRHPMLRYDPGGIARPISIFDLSIRIIYRSVMDLRKMRYFLAIADQLNFHRAAEKLNVSQPALSQCVKALEAELGAQLLDRSSRGVALTESGAVFARGARQVLREAEFAVASTRLADRGERGSLTIAFNEVGGQQPVVGQSLALFRAAFPNVTVRLAEMGEAAQHEALRSGAIDAGFHFRLPARHSGLAARVLDTQQFMLVVPETHALAKCPKVHLADLTDQPMIMLRRDVNADTNDGIRQAFEQQHAMPQVVLEASSDAAMLTLVTAGLGLAIVMGAQRRGGWDGLALRPIEGLSLAKEFVLAWQPDNRSSALVKFIALIEQPVDPG